MLHCDDDAGALLTWRCQEGVAVRGRLLPQELPTGPDSSHIRGMPNPPRKIRPTRSKASRPALPPLEEHLRKLLNPGLAEARQADQAKAAHGKTGFGEARQASFEGGPVTADRALAEAFDLPRPDGSAEMGGRIVKRRPRPESAEPDADGLDRLGGSAGTIKALTKLLEGGDPRFHDKPIWTPHRPPRPDKSEGGVRFELVSEYEPAGDQPTAIAELVAGVNQQERDQVLLGVTGSGKTFTMAQVIAATQRPALILAPNKTLAAQLYGEFKSFFPNNAVEYFVSYYDYYQPEAYVPRTDTYIEKESSINEQIDRMRHSATRSLLERDDVIIVASVSCIYGIGSVETYTAMTFGITVNERVEQRQLIADLVALQYKRISSDFARGTFRVRGDVIELFPAHYEDRAWRISLFGDEVEFDRGVRPAHRPENPGPEVRQGLRQLPLRHPAADAQPGGQGHQG